MIKAVTNGIAEAYPIPDEENIVPAGMDFFHFFHRNTSNLLANAHPLSL